MQRLREIVRQLRLVGLNNNLWGWSEIKRLPSVLEDDEQILRAVSGFYQGGHALVIATDKRILFLDGKMMSFKVEDIHYEMVSEVIHVTGIFTAKLRIRCISNEIELTSYAQRNVRDFATFVDAKVNSIRLNMRTWEQMMESAITPEMPTGEFRTRAAAAMLRTRRTSRIDEA